MTSNIPLPHWTSLHCTWTQGSRSVWTVMKVTRGTLVLTVLIHNTFACFPFPPPPSPSSTSGGSTSSSSNSNSNSNSNNNNNNNNNNSEELGVEELTYDPNCNCGVPKTDRNRIVGGQPADKNEYPWQVALKRAGRNVPFCGGSILSSKTILTAAHCKAYSARQIRYRVVRCEV